MNDYVGISVYMVS